MLARSQSTRAAVRQNEMNVNITLVTTSTWPADGPCRFGRGEVIVAGRGGVRRIRGEERIGHQQSVPVDASGVSDQVGDYNGVAARSSRGGSRSEPRQRAPGRSRIGANGCRSQIVCPDDAMTEDDPASSMRAASVESAR